MDIFHSPLHVAAMKGDVEAIKAMKKSVQIIKEENGQTPLHLAVIKGKRLAVRELISLRADLKKMNKDGCAPLHLAVLHDHVSLIEDLINIDTESDVDIFDRNGNTALHVAIKIGNVHAARALLVEGANADQVNNERDAPLHLAVLQGNLKMIDILCKYVRKPNVLDKNQFSPLHLAVLYNRIGAIRTIGKIKGFKVYKRDINGDNTLHLATKLRNLEAIEALLGLGASVNVSNARGFSPIQLAVDFSEMKETEILKNIDRRNRFKNAPVYVAGAQKDIPALRLLCSSKVNVALRNTNSVGNSVLHTVVMSNCKDAVKILLDSRAKVNSPNQFTGKTPLHNAVCFGNKDIIEMLIERGADIYIGDKSGDKPIHSSARFCNSVGIATLIKHKRMLSVKNSDMLTPLDIIMLYVREDTFGTAVPTINELYKEKKLKRKIPITCHEILKCAKLIFKFEILKNFCHSKLNESEYLYNILPILRSYINDCFAEIRLMKSTLFHGHVSLYKFVMNDWDNKGPLTHEYTSELIINHILDVSASKGYPFYRDVIVLNLERSSLLKYVSNLGLPVIRNEKTTFLDLDAIYKYLDDGDILNLLLAYSDLKLEISLNPEVILSTEFVSGLPSVKKMKLV